MVELLNGETLMSERKKCVTRTENRGATFAVFPGNDENFLLQRQEIPDSIKKFFSSIEAKSSRQQVTDCYLLNDFTEASASV
jgi:hypothetical protein